MAWYLIEIWKPSWQRQHLLGVFKLKIVDCTDVWHLIRFEQELLITRNAWYQVSIKHRDIIYPSSKMSHTKTETIVKEKILKEPPNIIVHIRLLYILTLILTTLFGISIWFGYTELKRLEEELRSKVYQRHFESWRKLNSILRQDDVLNLLGPLAESSRDVSPKSSISSKDRREKRSSSDGSYQYDTFEWWKRKPHNSVSAFSFI